jgi:hypothetical protein
MINTEMQYRIRELCKIIDYNPETGELRWTETINQFKKKGEIASKIESNGQHMIFFKHKYISARKIAWFITYGDTPRNIYATNKKSSELRIKYLTLSKQKNKNYKTKPKTVDYKLTTKIYPFLPDEVKNPDSKILACNCFVPIPQVALWDMI